MAKSGNTVDLSKLSIEELQNLTQAIQEEITSRRAAERERVLQQMRDLASSAGMTLEEILKPSKPSGGVSVKYRHPENPALTWTGRGKRPTWLNEALAGGKNLEDFAV